MEGTSAFAGARISRAGVAHCPEVWSYGWQFTVFRIGVHVAARAASAVVRSLVRLDDGCVSDRSVVKSRRQDTGQQGEDEHEGRHPPEA